MIVRTSILAALAAAAPALGVVGCADSNAGSAVPRPGGNTNPAAPTTQSAATQTPAPTPPNSSPAGETTPASTRTVEGTKNSDVLSVDKVKLRILEVSWGGESPDSKFNVEVCATQATTMGEWTYEAENKAEKPQKHEGSDKALPLSGAIEAGKCVSGWLTFANGPHDLTYTAPSGDVAVWHTKGW